jgi:alpha-tubulin suppressor-like RCC1 family protein
MLAAAALLTAACGDDPSDPGPDWPPQGTLVSGDLQRDTVGDELSVPLVVRVTDQDGDAIAGISVTFAVTAGGGTLFAATAQTSSAGEASNRWTLGTAAGDTQRVEARIIDPESGQPVVLATFRAVGLPDAPAAIAARPPAARTGSAGQVLADSLEAIVTDRFGNPVPGVTVTWLAVTGGGAVAPATTLTGANGIARAAWTLGRQVGTQQTAEASLSPAVRAQFTATAGVPLGTTIVKVSGDGQAGTAGTTLAQPLAAEVRTALGEPLQGVSLSWVPAAAGSGTATPPVAVTGPDGRASTTWTLGSTAGQQALLASAEGLAGVVFEATATPGAAAQLAIVEGSGQTAPPNAPLPVPLRVRVADGFGNPLPGATVTWTVAEGGGSVVPTASLTNAGGIAETQWNLGPAQGAQSVTASVPGTNPVTFTATAQTGPVDRIEVTPAALTLTSIGATRQLAARAVDAYGNTVSGVTITWRSNSTAVATVDGAGTVRAIANGSAQIHATGAGKVGTANATVQQVAAAVAVSGARAVVESETVQLSAVVRDSLGTVIAGAAVSWSSSAPGVATVSQAGVVTGTGGGAAVVTATSGPAGANHPVTVRGAFRADTVAVGSFNTCTLTGGGTAYCWGLNRGAQLAFAPNTDLNTYSPRPRAVSGQTFTSVTTGSSSTGYAVSHSCGLQADDDALCWGNHESGQLGYDDGPRADSRDGLKMCKAYDLDYVLCNEVPTQTGGGGWRQVDAGADHSCAVTTGGAAFCWGRSTVGQLGTTAATETCYKFYDYSGTPFACILTPAPVTGGLTWRQVSAGDDFTCGLTTGGAAYCWGRNHVGQLGNGTTANAPAPTPVSGGPYRWISAGRTHACAVTTTGAVRCWGSNVRGRLGNGSTAGSTVPVTVAAPGDGSTWASVEAGDPHTCALTSTGRPFCWGGNGDGQLGDGTTTDRLVPTAVSTARTFASVGAGLNFSCGRSSAGIVLCWGSGSGGKLGDGAQNNHRSLVPFTVGVP